MATELVQAFNGELASLYETKPPISKAKMSQITKMAIRGIKMYKHVVQSVERFIAKCRPEYKLPGLYVIDSIVRQSRHQWGPDKDVFGPRFMRNFHQTFSNLFASCPPGDKPKIVRVLNLWQRNSVFSTDVIQPLLDMANPNICIKTDSSQVSDGKNDPEVLRNLQQLAATLGLKNNGNLSGNSSASTSMNETNQQHLNTSQAKVPFNRDILKFDYSDEEDAEGGGETPTESEPPTSAMTANHHLSQQQSSSSASNNDPESESNPLAWTMAQNLLLNPEILQRLQRIQQAKDQQAKDHQSEGRNEMVEEIDRPSATFVPSFTANEPQVDRQQLGNQFNDTSNNRGGETDQDLRGVDRFGERRPPGERRWDRKSRFDRDLPEPTSGSRRKRSRSRSRSPGRSRDRDGERRNRRSPERSRYQEREPSPGEIRREKEREKERERRKRGLPPLKPGYITICSTTLWLGHVPKLVSEADISDAFGEFGTINSIELIPPRGCAYVCMNSRQDAYRILTNSSKGLKLHGSTIKMAWAPGKGTKGKEFKEFWEVDVGSSYIPWDRVPPNIDLEPLEEGGMIDEESLPSHLAELRKQKMFLKLEQEKAEQLLREQNAAAEKLKSEAQGASSANPSSLLPPPLPPLNLAPPPNIMAPPPQPPQLPPLNLAPGMGIPGMMPPPTTGPPPGAIPLDQLKNLISYPIQKALSQMQPGQKPPSVPSAPPLLPSTPGHLGMSGPPPPLFSGPPLAVPPPQVLSGQPPPPLPWGTRPSGPPPSGLTGPNAQPLGFPRHNPLMGSSNVVVPPFAPHLKPASLPGQSIPGQPVPNQSMVSSNRSNLPPRIHPDDLPPSLHESSDPSDDPFAPSLYELKNMNRGRPGPYSNMDSGGRPSLLGRFEDSTNFRSRFSEGSRWSNDLISPDPSSSNNERNQRRGNQNHNFRDERGNGSRNQNWTRNSDFNPRGEPEPRGHQESLMHKGSLVHREPLVVKDEPMVNQVPDVGSMQRQSPPSPSCEPERLVVPSAEKPVAANPEISTVSTAEEPVVSDLEEPMVTSTEAPTVSNPEPIAE